VPMNPNATAFESLAEIICRSAGARLVHVEQRRGQPTLIHFAPDVPGEPPIESLPIAEFNSRAVRLALKNYRVEEVEVIR
jgi:hypothetical protein